MRQRVPNSDLSALKLKLVSFTTCILFAEFISFTYKVVKRRLNAFEVNIDAKVSQTLTEVTH